MERVDRAFSEIFEETYAVEALLLENTVWCG